MICQSTENGAGIKSARLSPPHRTTLEDGSGISRDIIAERGVRTITRGHELPVEFSRRQRKLASGMLFTIHRPNASTACSFRPDDPDPESPGRKYEQPPKSRGGPGNVLDIHPSLQPLIANTNVPVVFVEGVKKADSITSAARAAELDLLVVAISGVWNWLEKDEAGNSVPIPDLNDLPLVARRVYVCFDSDMLQKPEVQEAASRLAQHTSKRGGDPWVTFLPDGADGSKTGADDFLVGGGSLREMRLLSRPYDYKDFALVRLDRDAKLRSAVEDLERRHAATKWTWPGADSDEDVYLKLIEAGRRHGKVVADGIRVTKAWGPLGLEAKISSRTISKAISRLEERGLLYRDNKDREFDKAGAFVLCASVKYFGKEQGRRDKVTQGLREFVPGTLHTRSPRLWASKPKWKPTKKMIQEHRLGVRTWMPEPREGIKRLGKRRGHCLDRLDAAGGQLTLEELGEKMGVRPRDLVRRKNTPKGRDGLLVWLEDAGIVAIDGGTASLNANWLEKLEEQRERGQEIQADEVARQRYKEKSLAYHARDKRRAGRKKGPKQGVAGLEAVRRSRARRDEYLREAARLEEERRRAGPPPALKDLLAGMLRQLDGGHLSQIRLGLLCMEAAQGGFGVRDVSEAVLALGYKTERIAAYDNEEFVMAQVVA